MNKIAVLLTSFNRKDKTLTCLDALFKGIAIETLQTTVYLAEDCSTDGTASAVSENFPQVKIINGTGSLFWAGGMRLAWNEALKYDYNGYLLLNDDTIMDPRAINELRLTEEYSLLKYGKRGIYIGSTQHPDTKTHTYGGVRVNNLYFPSVLRTVLPNGEHPRSCHLGNANIMYVPKEVIDTIGIFSDHFTHGIADYDYTLRALRKKIPVLICANFCGICEDDHGKNWLGPEYTLKQRIGYLKSIKGLAYTEYLYFIRHHFPLYYPVSFVKLWVKVFFPLFWEKFKK